MLHSRAARTPAPLGDCYQHETMSDEKTPAYLFQNDDDFLRSMALALLGGSAPLGAFGPPPPDGKKDYSIEFRVACGVQNVAECMDKILHGWTAPKSEPTGESRY